MIVLVIPFPLLGPIVTLALGITVVYIIGKITRAIIAKQAKKKYKNAIKAKILDVNTRRVKVGIYEDNYTYKGELVINSTGEVDNSLRKGQIIYV